VVGYATPKPSKIRQISDKSVAKLAIGAKTKVCKQKANNRSSAITAQLNSSYRIHFGRGSQRSILSFAFTDSWLDWSEKTKNTPTVMVKPLVRSPPNILLSCHKRLASVEETAVGFEQPSITDHVISENQLPILSQNIRNPRSTWV
jgi:hypothetical protein